VDDFDGVNEGLSDSDGVLVRLPLGLDDTEYVICADRLLVTLEEGLLVSVIESESDCDADFVTDLECVRLTVVVVVCDNDFVPDTVGLNGVNEKLTEGDSLNVPETVVARVGEAVTVHVVERVDAEDTEVDFDCENVAVCCGDSVELADAERVADTVGLPDCEQVFAEETVCEDVNERVAVTEGELERDPERVSEMDEDSVNELPDVREVDAVSVVFVDENDIAAVAECRVLDDDKLRVFSSDGEFDGVIETDAEPATECDAVPLRVGPLIELESEDEIT
jgi:hypothetical protein